MTFSEKEEHQFVSYLTAKLAQERGFDIYCSDCYETSNTDPEFHCDTYTGLTGADGYHFDCYRPTQTFLQKWLREKYSIDIYVVPHTQQNKIGYINRIQVNFCITNEIDYKIYSTYEEALEHGLSESLKLVTL